MLPILLGQSARQGFSTAAAWGMAAATGAASAAYLSLSSDKHEEAFCLSSTPKVPVPRKTPACEGNEHTPAYDLLRERAHRFIQDQSLPRGYDRLRLFSGTANPALSSEIAGHLGVPLSDVSVSRFADGEIGVQVNDNVRGQDVYIIQPVCPPDINDRLIELLLLTSTMRRASARSITCVIPYYAYGRQDRKMRSRVPISASDVATLIQSMGVDRVLIVDAHSPQSQGFFSVRTPVDNLEGAVVGLPHFASLGLEGDSTVIVSPDAGGVGRAKAFRDGLMKVGLNAKLAMIIKQRVRAGVVGSMDLVGDVKGCDAIIVDDMIDTAGTLTKAAAQLKEHGARRVYAFATHGLFSGPAVERIQNSVLESVVVTNTIPLSEEGKNADKISQISTARLIASAIDCIHTNKSVSTLFKM